MIYAAAADGVAVPVGMAPMPGARLRLTARV
jgi:hypothetical protein